MSTHLTGVDRWNHSATANTIRPATTKALR